MKSGEEICYHNLLVFFVLVALPREQADPWLIHANVWQKPLQCCKVVSLQLIKINEK